MKKHLLFLACLFYFNTCLAGIQTDTTKNFKVNTFPFAYYLPESSLGFGAAGVATFRFPNESMDSRPSSFQFGAVYTLKNQILFFLPFELYKDEGNIRFEGELGYYKYFYNFFGIGSQSNKSDLEFYDVTFPRVRATLSRRLGDSPIYTGVLYQYDGMNFTSIEEGGILDIEKPIGWDGGVISNLGIELLYDDRDNLFTTRKGTNIKIQYYKALNILGSDFDYENLSIRIGHFIPINQYTLGFDLFTGSKYGETPFFDMYYVGTPKTGRGISDRRYQDKCSYAFQSEFRFPVYKRFGGVVFATINTVSENFMDFRDSNWIPTIGTGMRYTVNERDLNQVRIDVGFYMEGFNIYATSANAF